jgi:hypothetical protein
MSKRYGNENYWCFLEDAWDGKNIAIWRRLAEQEEIIAYAIDKYDARLIVDALLNYTYVEDKTKFGKKELAFLDFARAHFVEPYATMAANAILWNDRGVYEKLKTDFSTIYS